MLQNGNIIVNTGPAQLDARFCISVAFKCSPKLTAATIHKLPRVLASMGQEAATADVPLRHNLCSDCLNKLKRVHKI
jgi:hypothetical protein